MREPSALSDLSGPIVVAMSGGVDSSATAALLAAEGHNVIGVTLQLYDHGMAVGKKGACCAGIDIHDARRVADAIGIPHYVLDYETRFRDEVIAPFADSYARGETPIPCVLCNQTVKFRDLLHAARQMGAAALATGHYVRRVAGGEGPELHRGRDPGRDQSYFLFATTREQLDFLRFPLGGLTKEETRDLARRFALPVSEKPDSQDICFVPDGDYGKLVSKLRPGAAEPGEIVDREGRVLGNHSGVIHFTIGQRRGIGIGGGDPLYVTALDPENRRVIVGPKEALARTRFRIRTVNWLGEGAALPADRAIEAEVKIRSTRPPVAALVRGLPEGEASVELMAPEEGIAPGQACVLYRGERVLGGGWICREA